MSVVVGLVGGGGGEVGGLELELDADAFCGLAEGGVEDVAGYAVFCDGVGHFIFGGWVGLWYGERG